MQRPHRLPPGRRGWVQLRYVSKGAGPSLSFMWASVNAALRSYINRLWCFATQDIAQAIITGSVRMVAVYLIQNDAMVVPTVSIALTKKSVSPQNHWAKVQEHTPGSQPACSSLAWSFHFDFDRLVLGFCSLQSLFHLCSSRFCWIVKKRYFSFICGVKIIRYLVALSVLYQRFLYYQ